MQSAVLEQRIEREEEVKDIEDEVYLGNRLFAATQFAREVVKYNQECLKNPVENQRFYEDSFFGRFKDNLDKKSSFVLDAVGPYLCYTTAINSFIYASLALKYSRQDQGYTFFKKPKNRLSVVG